MANSLPPYNILPLGDSALILDFGNTIDADINKEVVGRFNQLLEQPIPGMIESIPAYSSLTLHYDTTSIIKKKGTHATVFDWMKEQLEQKLQEPITNSEKAGREIRIPVCYEYDHAPDLALLASMNELTTDEVIRIHCSRSYKVYMLGFLPGFGYMGEVDERIAMHRKQQPQIVPAGSVGIAGRQTGIYPLVSPGGWQIIGSTPIKMFDPASDEPTFLQTGDSVSFYPISSDEFKSF